MKLIDYLKSRTPLVEPLTADDALLFLDKSADALKKVDASILLSNLVSASTLIEALNNYITLGEKGSANGVADLDANARISNSVLPHTVDANSRNMWLNGVPSADYIGTPVRLQKIGMASGQNEIYTVPTGKRLFVRTSVSNIGTSGASYSAGIYIKTGSGYIRVGLLSTVSSAQARADAYAIVLEAGETYCVYASTAGGNHYAYGFLVDNAASDFNLFRAWMTTFTGTATLLYTVPVGKQAFIFSQGSAMPTNGTPAALVANDSGSSGIMTTYFVPSGEVWASKFLHINTTVSNGAGAVPSGFLARLEAGDSIYVNSTVVSSNNQSYMITGIEW